MERISVTDFGPIQHAEIEIKPFCILIGHTSSGKSTVAKLLDLIVRNFISLSRKTISFLLFLC